MTATGESIVVRETTSPDAIVELLHFAVEKGVSAETLERLHALHERVADRNARMAFFAALARFQELCPPVGYSKQVKYVSNGQRVNYGYAELPHIVRTIRPFLKQCDLSYGWDTEVKGDTLITKCTLRHVDGHSECSLFSVPTESRAGMSPSQKFGAAGTYGRRQSLCQVLGIVTAEPDTDGVAVGNATPITEEQAQDLESLLSEHGCDLARFLKWASVATIAELPAAQFEAACQMVREVGEARAARKAKKDGPK